MKLLSRFFRNILAAILGISLIFTLPAKTIALPIKDILCLPFSVRPTTIQDQIARANAKVWGAYPDVQECRPPQTLVAMATPIPVAIATKVDSPSPPATPISLPNKDIFIPEPILHPKIVLPPDDWGCTVLALINQVRTQQGLAVLVYDPTLTQLAELRCSELPVSPQPHLRPDGKPFYTVFNQFDYKTKQAGENYAIGTAGCFSAEQIVQAWLDSPGHYANLVNPYYTKIGLAHQVIDEREFCEQLFAD